VDFKNTVLIMTSNVGSHLISAVGGGGRGQDDAAYEAMKRQVTDALRQQFRPEFLNRIDEIILFKRLSRANMGDIVRIQLQRVDKMLAERRMTLALDAEALQWLADKGYDPVYGARPLKRVIQKDLIDPIAKKLLAGDLEDGGVIAVGAGADGLAIGKATLQ
jgi:ATP-dependent Clp protease ATP-binding subunit ClpB